MSSNKFVVALTGGIGSGKSTVAELFAQRGVPIIDTDLLSRQLTLPGSAILQTLVAHFGHRILHEAALNRKVLREIIFAEPAERVWLETLLHPLIRAAMRQQIADLPSAQPYCIVVIPLLFETPPNPLINRVLVVDTTADLQVARVIARDTHTAAEVHDIMRAQVSRQTRLAQADDVILNIAGLAALDAQVTKLHQIYLQLATAG